MTQYTVQNGQNLWKIVKQEYGLTNNSDIQKKVSEIVKLNNLSKGGSSIFVNQKINLPDAKNTSVFDNNTAQSSEAQTSGSKGLTANALITDSTVTSGAVENKKPEVSQMKFVAGISKLQPVEDNSTANQTQHTPANNVENTKTNFVPGISSNLASDYTQAMNTILNNHIQEPINKDNPFDEWGQECASSVSGIDYNTGDFQYSKNVEDFDLTGDEYRKLQSEDPQKAKELYNEKLLNNSSNEMKLYDKDGDEAFDLKENLDKEVADSEAYIGMPLGAEDKEEIENGVFKAHAIMDLNNDSKVDKKEYSAFLATTDSMNEKNGKISRDEYNTALLYLEQDSGSEEANRFRTKLKNQYNELGGTNTDDKKTE